MSEAKFCPRCHRKNDVASLKCSFCGLNFEKSEVNIRTTNNVPTAVEMPDMISPCAGQNLHIPVGQIGLFFETGESIIRETQDSFILGRYGQTVITSSTFIDLMSYGAAELGVSRNHARIYYENGDFFVEDLDSTNGSWLNGMQLAPGHNYPLQDSDQLTLGRLRICICLGERPLPAAPTVTFTLQKESVTAVEAKQTLSLAALQNEILPYLETTALVQEIIDACLQRPSQPTHILNIQAAPNSGAIIKASGLAEAVNAIADRTSAWRNLHQDAIGVEPSTLDPTTHQSLIQLAIAILTDQNPQLSSEEKFIALEKLAPKLVTLALSPLTLSIG